MKQFLITLAGVFSGLLLFFVGLPLLLISLIAAGAQPAPAPGHTVLTLDLRQALTDQESQSPLSFLNARNLSVITVVETLSRASRDSNVQAMLIRLPEGGMPPAQADELRLAIKNFRAAGKSVWDAVIDAADHRLRPIMLTAAAAILGMIPIMHDVFWGPMAYAIVGGLTGATLLTMLFLPALYVAWFGIKETHNQPEQQSPEAIMKTAAS